MKSLSQRINESFEINESFSVGDNIKHVTYDKHSGKIETVAMTLSELQKKGYDGDEENFESSNPKKKEFFGATVNDEKIIIADDKTFKKV